MMSRLDYIIRLREVLQLLMCTVRSDHSVNGRLCRDTEKVYKKAQAILDEKVVAK